MGVNIDVMLKDKANPMIGGKVHVEMPVSEIWKILEKGTSLLMTPFQKEIYETIFGKLFELQTFKADIIYNGEQILQGIYDITVVYTFVHKDGTEEKGTFKLEGKKAIVKAHVELPVSEITKVLKGLTSLLNEFMTPSQKLIYEKIIGKLFEIKTIKADITFTGEQILQGIYDIVVVYTFVHIDQTEEKGTFKL